MTNGEAGYTLIETLTALVMISLAMGGLSVGLQVVAGSQGRIGASLVQTESARSVQTMLERTLQPAGAFRAQDSARFVGRKDRFDYACDAAVLCKAEIKDETKGATLVMGKPERHLPLHAKGPVRFVYQGSAGGSDVWPPTGTDRQALTAISMVDEANLPIVTAKLWSEQPGLCAFDVVMQDCR